MLLKAMKEVHLYISKHNNILPLDQRDRKSKKNPSPEKSEKIRILKN